MHASLDPERVRGLLDVALRTTDDPRVDRMLLAGASLLMRPEDGDVIVSLAFVDGATPILAALRSVITGAEPGVLADDDLDACVQLARVPRATLNRVNQG